MNIQQIIIAGSLGLFGGIFTGLTGLTILGPILIGLITANITDYKTLIGTLLYVNIFPITLGSFWEFYNRKKINFLLGNILFISIFIGSIIGAKINLSSKLKISNKTIKYITGIISILVGIYFLFAGYYSET